MSVDGSNEITQIKMEVNTMEGFTGHSGRKQLLNFVYRCDPKPKKVIVNHGESSRCLDLASSIHKLNRVETSSPRNFFLKEAIPVPAGINLPTITFSFNPYR